MDGSVDLQCLFNQFKNARAAKKKKNREQDNIIDKVLYYNNYRLCCVMENTEI